MKTTRTIALGLSLVAATAGAGVADDAAAALSPGATVRLAEAPGPRLKATVLEVSPGSLLVRTEPGAAPRRIDLTSLYLLEVSTGRRGNAGRGALIGFLPGAVAGAVLSGLGCEGDCSGDGSMETGMAIVGAATALIGAAIGAAIKTEHWRPLHLPGASSVRLLPSVTPVRGGMAAGLTLRF